MRNATEVLQTITAFPEIFAVAVVCVALLVRVVVDAVWDFGRKLLEVNEHGE